MPRLRAAAEIEPVRSIACSSSAFPGPMAMALRNMMRICGFADPFLRTPLVAVDFPEVIPAPSVSGPTRSSRPPLGRRVVAGASFDPAAALWRLFLLPERCLRLEVIHHELAGREGLAPM